MRHLDRDYVVPGDPDDALIRLSAAVAGVREATATRDDSSRLLIREVWRPVWTYLVAVVFFPFGLFALMIRAEARLVAAATATPDGTRIYLVGRGHEVVCDAVLETLRTMATTQVVRK
jgi:hypothetical protein